MPGQFPTCPPKPVEGTVQVLIPTCIALESHRVTAEQVRDMHSPAGLWSIMSGVSLVFGTDSDSLSVLESLDQLSRMWTEQLWDYTFEWDPNGALGVSWGQ